MTTEETMREPSTTRRTSLQTLRSAMTLADIWIVSSFAVFSLLYFLSQWKGAYPYVFLGGDAANISSFVAGWGYPELFKGDAVLGNAGNFRFYATIHFPLTQLLAKVTGDYGSAYIFMLAPHIFLQMLGFYVLGRVVFGNRYWAVLLTIVTSATVYFPLGEYWGVYIEPQPRFTFQAFLPFLLAAAFYYRCQPKAWPWVMAGAGSLIYVHPVSAPGWGLALWLGFWCCRPVSWSFGKQLRHTLWASAAFFLPTVPWVIFYFLNHAHGTSGNYETIVALMGSHYNPGYVDVGLATRQFLELFWTHRGIALAILILLPSLFIIARGPEKPPELKLIFTWMVGLVLSSVGVTFVEQAVERAFRMVPLQIDLIRGLRYILPLLLLTCLWCLYYFSKSAPKEARRAVCLVGAFFTFAYTLNSYFFLRPPAEALWQVTQGRLLVLPQEWREVSDSLQVVKSKTPPHSRILPFGGVAARQALSLRYYALRPVVYTPRDKAALGYANHKAFLEWHWKYQTLRTVAKEPHRARQAAQFLHFCRSLNVDYCLLDSKSPLTTTLLTKATQAKVIHANRMLTLFQIHP